MLPNPRWLQPSSMPCATRFPNLASATSTYQRHLKKSGEACGATDMSAFEYASPQSIEEAIAILASRSGARPLAGGQNLLVERNRDRLKGAVLVDLGRISSLKGIDPQNGGIRIGATSTLNAIASSHLVAKEFPVLAETAATIGDAQLRNRGTIGGNIAE